jgi:Fur family transcriptional regulator, peroxide stress response regulator
LFIVLVVFYYRFIKMAEVPLENELITALKQAGFRLTPQRVALARILVEEQTHLTVEQIYSQLRGQFPTTSLATVYKTIAVLKDLGLVHEIRVGDNHTRYDGSHHSSHSHLICTHCKVVIDAQSTDLDLLATQAAKRSGYRIEAVRLDFFGVCPDCQAKEYSNSNSQ